MKTHREMLSAGGLDGFDNYMGEVIPDNFLILLGRNRDSDILTNANWDVALEQLGEESETVRIDRIGHWAVGWVEYLSVDKNDADKLKVAEEIEAALADYPVLDDEYFSQKEGEEADEFWENNYTDLERLEYIRDNRSQFEFGSYQEMRECIRGEYFCGYASELIS